MTVYKQVNATDTWPINEVVVGNINGTSWIARAKLPHGRVPIIHGAGPLPEAVEEPLLLAALIRRDNRDRWHEFWLNLWGHLTRCRGCSHAE